MMQITDGVVGRGAADGPAAGRRRFVYFMSPPSTRGAGIGIC